MKSVYNYIIIEDVPLQQEYLKSLLDARIDLNCVGVFNHHRPAYDFLIGRKNPAVDIIFLDIELPGEYDGLNFLKTLQDNMQTLPAVIITTAHNDYAVEAFEYPVSGYVLKIITKEALYRAINKVLKEIHEKSLPLSVAGAPSVPVYYDFKISTSIVRIFFREILFCEGANVYVKLHKIDGTIISPRMTLISLEAILPALRFLRIHNSFIANMKYLSSYAPNYHEIELKSPDSGKVYKVPIGKGFREKLKEFLERDSNSGLQQH